MAKKVIGFIKLQIPAGQANPAPPVGPALGQQGVNIMDFCKSFNAKTQDKTGDIIPVEITVYADRSFSFVTKTPPAAKLILKSANISKGSSEPNKEKVGLLDVLSRSFQWLLSSYHFSFCASAKQQIYLTDRVGVVQIAFPGGP